MLSGLRRRNKVLSAATLCGIVMPFLYGDCLNDRSGNKSDYVGLRQTESESGRRKFMWDIGCIVATVAFFLIAIAYATGCERLGTKEGK
jgi:hypothetical protein